MTTAGRRLLPRGQAGPAVVGPGGPGDGVARQGEFGWEGTSGEATPPRGGAAGTEGKNGGVASGAVGGKGGNGEEDKEKKPAPYLQEADPDGLFGGSDVKPTPPVIGEPP